MRRDLFLRGILRYIESMAIPLEEFLRRRKEEASDADRRARESPAWGGAEAIATRLDDLARQAAEGVADVDVQLAALLEHLAEDQRDEAVQRFRSKVEVLERESTLPPLEMTPEQELLMQQMKEHEKSVIAHLLHEKTREKIRRIFLLNPSLWGQVMGISEQLYRRGVLTPPTQSREPAAQLGQITPQPVQNPEKKKDQERER